MDTQFHRVAGLQDPRIDEIELLLRTTSQEIGQKLLAGAGVAGRFFLRARDCSLASGAARNAPAVLYCFASSTSIFAPRACEEILAGPFVTLRRFVFV